MAVGNRLTDMEFDEISLVTRPANQLSKVILFKSDSESDEMTTENEIDTDEMESEDDVEKGYGKGKAMPMMDDEDEDEDEEEMGKMGRKMKKDDDTISLPTEVYEYIESLEAANAEMLDRLEKMDEEYEAQAQDILKSADPQIVAIVKAAEERAEAAEKIAKAERDHRLEREYVAKAAAFDALPVEAEKFGKVLKSAADALDSDTFDALMTVLNAANESISSGNIFAELGKSTSFENDGPMSEINKAAKRMQDQHPGMTHEQAIAKAVESDPNLYNVYLRGN